MKMLKMFNIECCRKKVFFNDFSVNLLKNNSI